MKLPLQIARKYVFSGKNAIEVNIISWIAFVALGFVTACLIVILSVFSGLEDINIQYYSDINPDAVVLPQQGKVINDAAEWVEKIEALTQVQVASKVIEERAFIDYNQKNHIVTIKGVDDKFNQIFGLDTMVIVGNSLSKEFPNDIILGQGVSSRLSLFVDIDKPATLYVPKPGEGLITKKEDAFNEIKAYGTGIFIINDKYREYVFAQLALVQELLGYQPQQVSAIEVKSKEVSQADFLEALENTVGDNLVVKSREEIDAAFTKMMNTENLIIYLIFILILVIASFNLAGSVAILILNKKNQTATLHSLGMPKQQIKHIFFLTGLLITFYALVVGLVIGTAIVLVQHYYGLVSINMFLAFPVKFTLFNYLLTIGSVLVIGSTVSLLVSRQLGISSKKQAE